MAQKMPELKLRQELRTRFPEITGPTLMKVMKLYNNDTEKCIQALEHESQRALFGGPPGPNNHPQQPPNHNHNHTLHGQPGNNISRNNNVSNNTNNNSSAVGSMSGTGSQTSKGVPRYQEVPVQHETKHVSTVQHTVGVPPSIPPKPLPTQDTDAVARSVLVIDPVNKGLGPAYPGRGGVVRPHDLTPFLNASPRRQAEIPSIRCHQTGLAGGAGGSGVGAGGSPESRRPVRVINVQGLTSGGTVMSGAGVSPTAAFSQPRFHVVLGDGGGVCSMPASSAPTGPASMPGSGLYRFTGPAYPTPGRQFAQETERPGIHSSSIYIDPALGPRRTNNIQESGGGLDTQSSVHQHYYVPPPAAQYADSSAPSSLPVSRTSQPLTVSLSSHATPPPDRGPSAVSLAGMRYPASYNVGFATPPYNAAGGYKISMVPGGGGGGSVGVGGVRFPHDGTSPSPPRSAYSVSAAATALNQLMVSPAVAGAVGLPSLPSPAPSPVAVGMVSPVLLPKSPALQHQRSTGSSTSRSNSMDSEHGSHHPPDPHDFPHYSPLPPTLHHHHHQHRGSAGHVMMSPASSQSSLSSESSARDPNSSIPPRRRSGSVQEEAAYSQALLHHQQQRMEKLTEDIDSKRQLLRQLRNEVSDGEKSKIVKNSLRTTFPTADDIARLCESNRRLQTDIQMYLNEIDMYKNGQTPFSVIDPMGQQNFFNNMPTGPNDLFSRPQIQQREHTPPPPPPPRPTPLPPRVTRVNSNDLDTRVPPPAPSHIQGGGSADSEEGEKWACTACTFENHPALKKCEICEMPRLMAGS